MGGQTIHLDEEFVTRVGHVENLSYRQATVAIRMARASGFLGEKTYWRTVDQINCVDDLQTLVSLYAAVHNPEVCHTLWRELQIKKHGGDERAAMRDIVEQIKRVHAQTNNPDEPAPPSFIEHIVGRIDRILQEKQALLDQFPAVMTPLRMEFTAQSYLRTPNTGDVREQLYQNPTWSLLIKVHDFVDHVLSQVGDQGYIYELTVAQSRLSPGAVAQARTDMEDYLTRKSGRFIGINPARH